MVTTPEQPRGRSARRGIGDQTLNLIIVGAGEVGERLIRLATRAEHEVVVIERDEARAEATATEFDCSVLTADAGRLETLEAAGGSRADAIISTTDDDATNLVTAVLAGELGVPSRLSVVNDPGHVQLFRELGVVPVDDPQDVFSDPPICLPYPPPILLDPLRDSPGTAIREAIRYDPQTDAYHVTYDWKRSSPLTRIIGAAVAELVGVEPHGEEILESVDSAALDRLFSPRPDGTLGSEGAVSFSLYELGITVKRYGHIVIHRRGGGGSR